MSVRTGGAWLDREALLCAGATIERATEAWYDEGLSVTSPPRAAFEAIMRAVDALRDSPVECLDAVNDGTGMVLVEEMMTPHEIADACGFADASYVRRVCRDGELAPHTHRGTGRVLVEREAATSWIEGKRTDATSEVRRRARGGAQPPSGEVSGDQERTQENRG